MQKVKVGILLGIGAGIIDVIPMIIQKLSWDANLSAFSMWIVIGLFMSLIDIKSNSAFKGILISFLILLPTAILIGWKEPLSLIPIVAMTTILGGFMGYFVGKNNKQYQQNKRRGKIAHIPRTKSNFKK